MIEDERIWLLFFAKRGKLLHIQLINENMVRTGSAQFVLASSIEDFPSMRSFQISALVG